MMMATTNTTINNKESIPTSNLEAGGLQKNATRDPLYNHTTYTTALSGGDGSECGMSSSLSFQEEEGGSSSRDTSTIAGGGGSTAGAEEKIALKESRMVLYMRLILVLTLACSAVVVSMSVYNYLTADEQEDFENQFYSDANKILDGLGGSFDETLGAVDSFSSRMTAQTLEGNTSFPFVTVPGFGVQASKLLKLSKAYQFGTCLFVTPEQRTEWQDYAIQNNGWVEDVIEVQNNDNFWGPTLENWFPSYDIIGYVNETSIGPATDTFPGRDNYAVIWQSAPLLEEYYVIPYNFDQWMSEAAPDIDESVRSRKVVIAKSPNIMLDPDDPEQQALVEGFRQALQPFLPPDQDAGEPLTAITYPIIASSFKSVTIDIAQDPPVYGFVFFALYWRELVKNILPTKSVGLVVVFDSTCGDVFTYQLDGPETTYLGGGDLHDTKYDHLGVSSPLGDVMDATNSGRDSSYSGLPLNQDYCSRTIRIYPSEKNENLYITNNPWFLSVAAALIFLFTSLVFICYDYMVRRRQRIVNRLAMASSAIVNSLFPKQVAKQLYREQEEKKQKETNLKNFMNDVDKHGMGAVKSSKPIASFYDNTTILFADLAGFTKWSSSHTPEDVFFLLETFYGSFDQIAKRWGVFKVETVGDCYVAVTGIPEPREDHAVCMCKFAKDSMASVEQLKVELADQLGPETLDLQFRVGMHSGSVFAGVLRGEKGRFQLFGDAMNTASRMESNGIPGKIHVSQETADALTAMGRKNWLVPREEKVQAKGKGEMQTYFVEIKRGTKSVSSGVWSSVSFGRGLDDKSKDLDLIEEADDKNTMKEAEETIAEVKTLFSAPESHISRVEEDPDQVESWMLQTSRL